MGFVVMIWAVHAGVAAILSLPVLVFGRRRVHWYFWELLALILPFCVWACMFYWCGPSRHKGIGNVLFGEPVLLGLAIPLAGGRGCDADERVRAAIVLVGLCGVGPLVFFVTPNLGGSLG